MIDEPLVRVMVCTPKVIKGKLAGVDAVLVNGGGVGVIVVRMHSVFWITNESLVIAVVCTITLVNGDESERDISVLIVVGGGPNVWVTRVETVLIKEKTDDPLVVTAVITLVSSNVDVNGGLREDLVSVAAPETEDVAHAKVLADRDDGSDEDDNWLVGLEPGCDEVRKNNETEVEYVDEERLHALPPDADVRVD